ncbi:MAG: hypothetical protein CM1200mP13_10440 [Candidatus Pelagibacterales bacterium]|nr:MAG: hypothetical protein CM1200mP13_10440 [Pelagibacterales bacterium]
MEGKLIKIRSMLIIFTLFNLISKKLLLFIKHSYNSLAPSIDWEAPCANEGEKAKKALLQGKIFFGGIYKFLLTNIGNNFKILKTFQKTLGNFLR